ncbi:HipA domain-containing protein [Cellulomonas bogoriensis]|uniref:Phosphatidylinositol kinase n=1 Tax=Cellulomonas bogoriensis 69B4 = DSM 16987 TaxID=1386082 RepID=A0A0A0C202_9CELL|nr:HipA domain-containing protein [Cellulomonas bogoriensis]KGM13419.1 phosphatidylinositol kinase [Cellulomonas bogoriensis 69B4 = DSM 16987]
MTGELAVLLGGHVVATVTRARPGTLRLTYTGEGDGTPLSLSLPPETSPHVGAPVHVFLDALLPESGGVRAAIGRAHGADPSDLLDLLAAVGQDCAGAVQLCPPHQVDSTLERGGSLEPCSDGEIEARLDAMELDEDASWVMPGEHWSLGGTQGKVALRRHAGAWFIAHGAEPTTHILKPGIRRLRAQALIEHVSMRAAHLIGLDVAGTEYATFKSQDAIVVTRFDRFADDAGIVQRRHQEDMCQALGTDAKYEEYGGPSVADITRLLREVSPTPAAARTNVTRFLDGVIYNTVIGAPDAHGRNYAVLLDGEAVTVAPLYDVATGLAYDQPEERRLASMRIGGTFTFGQMDADAWRRLADEVQVDGDALLTRARQIADAAPAAAQTALDELTGDPDVDEVRHRLVERLESHAHRVTRDGTGS